MKPEVSATKIEVPEEILWDYKQAPDDILWRLQRIAEFFPAHCTDKHTIDLLYKYRDQLKIEKGKYILIGIYEEVWQKKASQGD